MLLSDKKYKITFLEGEEIEFKTLSAQSADQAYGILKQSSEDVRYIEYLFNTITENKYKDIDHNAGVLNTVIYACFKLSGVLKSVESLPDVYDNARDNIANGIFYHFYADVIRVMPNYKLDELKTKTTNELFELLAFAEKVVGKQIFDTAKMRKSIEVEATPQSSKKKGIASVTAEEIDFIKSMIKREETMMEGMPSY